MQVCARCLYTTLHPFGLTIDSQGICSGCRVHEEKDELVWANRAEKLYELLAGYRNHSSNNYDCIVPVSGGRDSYFIVHTIKKCYGLNPLLVTYNKHYNTSVGIRNLANLRMRLDCDIITQTVSPEKVKNITRETLRRFGSIYWHCLAGQTAFPVQMAVKLKIPLIIWGAHQGVDQVGMFSHLNEVEMTRKYRKEHDLMGFEAEDLVDNYGGVSERDLVPFLYPDSRELERVGVRGIYLNNYIRWDSRAQHEEMIALYGYETYEQNRTFDSYNDVDCWNYSDVHDYLKFLKYGYGKVTDHVCREIRLGRIARGQGIDLVRQYQTRLPKNLTLFLDWMGMTESAFFYIVDQHRNPRLWHRNSNWEWELSLDLLDAAAEAKEFTQVASLMSPHKDYMLTPIKGSTDKHDRYILVGKGV